MCYLNASFKLLTYVLFYCFGEINMNNNNNNNNINTMGKMTKVPIKKNGSVVDITFISDIVPHMVAISACNKDNG